MKSKKLLTILLSTIMTFSPVSSIYATGPVGKKSKSEPKTTTIFWEKSKQNNKKSTTNINEKNLTISKK
ncbi:bacillolysin [Clostridium botulinum CFSAN001628]|nr:bacillolysin [Clostridium botulinum CFSAN001628]RUT61995.1 hypothetical protein C1143_07570 [Clostridium botulinum]